MTRYIDTYRDRFGVEPICRTLQVAPSSYYAARRRQPSARAVSDAELGPKVLKVWTDNYRVYGARKLWRQLQREGVRVGRDRVGRLMRTLGITGAVRAKTRRTTIANPTADRAPDLVQRRFVATRPNQLWVSDFTYVASWSGTVYVAVVIDVFSRLIVGWRATTSMRTELVLDALEMAIWRRASVLDGLICHSDAGSQYTSIRYTERLAEIGAAPSVGSVGDSYDNSLAESTIGLYKTELIRRHGPWRTLEEVELATLSYIDWFNQHRLHGQIGNLPPAELEATYYRQLGQAAVACTQPPESPPRPGQFREPEPRATVLSSDRGCPLHTARDRCLWHVGGTAGENDRARTWRRRLPGQPQGKARLGNHCIVGKSPKGSRQVGR